MKKYSILLIISILAIILIAGCGGGGSTGVVPNNGSVTTIDPTATPGTLVEVPGNPTATPGSTIPSNLPTGTFKVEVQFPGSGSGLRAKDLAGSDLPYNSHTLRVTITGEAIATSIVGERNDLDPTGAGTYALTVSNVPVGLNTATIEVLDPSGNLLCQRKHGFYMTPGATEGPGLILLGVAIQSDGSYVPQNIDIPAGSSISFQNHDYTNDRTASMNSGAVTVGPIGHATHITQPVTAEVFPAINNLFNTQGQFDYDGQTGRVLVYGLPTLTSVSPDKDSTNGTTDVSFTLAGTNFGTSQSSVNGAVRFIQVNENDPNNPWGTVYNPSSFASWSNTSIAGSINLPSGKYRIEVSARGENTTESVFFYKGTGTYQITVGESELLNLADDFPTVTDNNSGNLRFGYKTSLASTEFIPQTNLITNEVDCAEWNSLVEEAHIWKNTTNFYYFGIAPGHVSFHPGWGTEVSVVRWISSFTGNVNIAGTFGQGDYGEVNVYIIKNNNMVSPLFSVLNTYNDTPFNLNSSVIDGDTIDFIVANSGDWVCDSTQLDLIITATQQ